MSKKSLAMLVAIVILVGLVAMLAYKGFDVMISLDYCRQNQERQKEEKKLLQSLLLHTAVNRTRAELNQLIRENYSDHLIKTEGNELSVDNVVLKFDGDKLVEVVSAE